MRKPISESQVEEAYEAVFRCLDGIEKHAALARRLEGAHARDSNPDDVRLPAGAVAEMLASVEALHTAQASAMTLLQGMEWDLPAVGERPIEHRGSVGSSWAETTILIAGRLSRDLDDWKIHDSLDAERKRYLLSVAVNLTEELSRFRPSLRMEAAKLRERAVSQSAEARFGYVLAELRPQARSLMQLFLDREGEVISDEDIAEAVCRSEEASTAAVHQAVHRLKAELERNGSIAISREIRSVGGGYRFR